jgi:hypothetical protein
MMPTRSILAGSNPMGSAEQRPNENGCIAAAGSSAKGAPR